MGKKESYEDFLLSEKSFCGFLIRQREEKRVTLDRLAEGLCEASHLARIEKGERPAEKMLRDRLLGRLGTNTERYENMLSASEYEEWEYQKHILKRLETGDTEDAKRLLEDYSACVCENDRLRMQFILTVQARIMKRQRADACCVRALLPHEEELGAVYGQALKLTVPAADCGEIQKMCLSIQELSLMLEYKRYHCADTVCGCYRNIINYIDNSNMDDKEKARIYPKAVYYYLRQEFLQGFLRAGEDNSGYLDVCNEAVRLLKRTGKTYYLWELLEIKDRILANTAAFWRKLGKKNEAAKWMQVRTGNRRWVRIFEKLYDLCGVSSEMTDSTYLYRQMQVSFIGDVLKNRREMLGLTQNQLCDGICSVKSLCRTENRKANMQSASLGALMKRLGVSCDFERADVVTHEREVLVWAEQTEACIRQHRWKMAHDLIQKIKSRISLENPYNRQYLELAESRILFGQGKIDVEEYIKRQKQALSYTLPYEAIFREGKRYMASAELNCVQNLAGVLEGEERNRHLKVLWETYQEYEERGEIPRCIGTYQSVMSAVAEELAKQNRFAEADAINRKMMRESLTQRRLDGVAEALYALWNREQQQERETGRTCQQSEKSRRETLEMCIALSEWLGDTYSRTLYKKKKHEWEGEILAE